MRSRFSCFHGIDYTLRFFSIFFAAVFQEHPIHVLNKKNPGTPHGHVTKSKRDGKKEGKNLRAWPCLYQNSVGLTKSMKVPQHQGVLVRYVQEEDRVLDYVAFLGRPTDCIQLNGSPSFGVFFGYCKSCFGVLFLADG